MIESLLDFKEVNRKPFLTFAWAFLITTIAVAASSQVAYSIRVGNSYVNLTGIFSVIFTIIPSVYFITTLLKREERIEEEEIKRHMEKKLWERHEKDLIFFLFYFFGVTFAFAIWSFFLGPEFFHIQLMKVREIRSMITGRATGFSSMSTFYTIFTNNMNVMFFSFIFSILFGAGAVFIIVWNASILGAYIGFLSRSVFDIPVVSLSFLPHGIPEILGYLCAGLAGGILSFALMRNHEGHVLAVIVIDALKIMVLGTCFIALGAFIEVFL